MLELRPEDLATGSRPGITLWLRKRAPGIPPDPVFSFEDLVLVRPQIRLPRGCDPRSERSWRDGVRAIYVPRLYRFVYLSPVPVSDLDGVEALGPEAGEAVELRVGKGFSDALEIYSGTGVVGRLSSQSHVRIGLALGRLRFRVASVTDGRPVLLAWSVSKLRAVAAILP